VDEFDEFSQDVLERHVGPAQVEELLRAMLDKGVLAIDLPFETSGNVGTLRNAAMEHLSHVTGLKEDVLKRASWKFEGMDPYLALLVAGLQLQSHSFPHSVFDIANSESRVLAAVPNLAKYVDDDGLVSIGAFTADGYGFDVGETRLHYHQLLRRDFIGSMNYGLISDVLRIGAQTGNVARLAYDDRRVTTQSEFSWSIEEDFWHGPHLTDEFLDDPYATGHTVHRYPESDPKLLLGYLAVDAQWSLHNEKQKVLQMEELVLPSSELVSGYHVVRYLHAIRDLEARKFIHCDGAVRCYTSEQYSDRQAEKVHTTSKSAKYRKLFRLDGSISTDDWSNVVIGWFRGNRLVEEYLSTLIN